MTDRLPTRVFRRRGHRALRRMSEQQRAIFWAIRFEEIGYPELAERHGISADEVQAELPQRSRSSSAHSMNPNYGGGACGHGGPSICEHGGEAS